MKLAIIIASDPMNGPKGALQSVFYALTLASEYKMKGDEVVIFFNGIGTRWQTEFSKVSHPAHALYNSVRDVVLGVSYGGADVFRAKDGVESRGASLKTDYAPVGMLDSSDLRRYLGDEWSTVVF
ncbi:MAG TPA: hypothetical protein PKD12_11080 [Nitrospira sp.]|nr:hypothetical protein [Nitrospira sp.]